jgi:hypothetical protein
VTVFCEPTCYRAPTIFDRRPSLDQFALSGFGAGVAFQEFGGDGLSLCSQIRGVAAQAGAMDAFLVSLSSLTTDGALCCVGLNAKQAQIPREFRPPMPKRRLLDVQLHTLLTDCLEHEMDMRVGFIGVEGERVSVREPDGRRGGLPRPVRWTNRSHARRYVAEEGRMRIARC